MIISKRLLFPFVTGLFVIQASAGCDDEIDCETMEDCHITNASEERFGCCIDGECKFEAADCAHAAVETAPAPARRAEAWPTR